MLRNLTYLAKMHCHTFGHSAGQARLDAKRAHLLEEEQALVELPRAS